MSPIQSVIHHMLDYVFCFASTLSLVQVNDISCGCEDLLAEISNRIKPRLNIFGHVHEGYGYMFREEVPCLFVNASTCTEHYRPTNAPIVVNLPIDKSQRAIVASDQYT
jgi:hypothetical protein